MDLTGVPDSIPFSKIQDFLTSLGIQLEDTYGVRVTCETVECMMYAKNAEGRLYADCAEDGDMKVAMHTICIPVVIDTRAASLTK